MIVPFQRSLVRYWVSLFNRLGETLDDEFTLILARPDRAPDRQWTVPCFEVHCCVAVSPGASIDIGRGPSELPYGVRAALYDLEPKVIVLGAYEAHVCWTALRWAWRRKVPQIRWVGSSRRTELRRSPLESIIRHRFLKALSAANRSRSGRRGIRAPASKSGMARPYPRRRRLRQRIWYT